MPNVYKATDASFPSGNKEKKLGKARFINISIKSVCKLARMLRERGSDLTPSYYKSQYSWHGC